MKIASLVAASAVFFSSLAGCASAPPPPSATPTSPPTAPEESAASTTTTAPTSQPAASPPGPPKVDFPPPKDLVWIDRQGNFALAAEKVPTEIGRCEVWNTQTKQRTAALTSKDSVAGGATPGCFQLSPGGHLVQYGNGRNLVWKNLADQVTACVGVVGPDDATCVEDDVTPFMFQGKGGDAADLDLHWSRATPNGAVKKVATIKRGLNRDGGDPKWWTVQYCSANKAVIDVKNGDRTVKNGDRTVIDARTGDAKIEKRGGPACP